MPALPIRRRSAGPISGDSAAGRPSTEGAANGPSSGVLGVGRSQPVGFDANTAFRSSRPLFSLPSDRSRIAPGPARSVLLIGAGSAPNQSWTIRLEYPSGTGDPNLPASAPAGTDLRPNLARRFPVRRPPTEAGGRTLRSRPLRATGPVIRTETSPVRGSDSKHLRAERRAGVDSVASPEGRRELCRILRSPQRTLPRRGVPTCGSSRPRTRRSCACRLQCLLRRLGPSRPAAADSVLAPVARSEDHASEIRF